MLRTFLLLGAFLFFSPIYTQSNFSREAELPSGSVELRAGTKDTADNRLLTAFYNRISYPRYAREKGITGAVAIILSIDDNGQLQVENSEFRTEEQLGENPIRLTKDDILTVTGFQQPAGTVPKQTKNEKRLAKGRKMLADEVARTFADLPSFAPATRNGEPVASSMVKMVFFKLE